MLFTRNRRITLAMGTNGSNPDLLCIKVKLLIMLVYVQDIDGKPLMPTKRCGKVRRMLRDGKAVVVEKVPFTIRLCYHSTSYTQEVTIGVDAGTVHVGVSATTSNEELYASQIDLRSDIVNLLSTRKELRRHRRSKLRYRKPRPNKSGRLKKGFIAPSVRHKIDSHIRIVNSVIKILPISRIIVEVASFDTQKIKNNSKDGSEYTIGEQSDFWNVREYILYRDEHTCQYCKGKSKDPVLVVHHIESRKTGGNAPNNLITLCKTCHDAYHRGDIELKFKRGKPLRDAAAMGIMKWKLYEELKCLHPNTNMTFGYITKRNRIYYNIDKSHVSDAFVISKNFMANRIGYIYKIRQTRRHNRRIHKAKITKGGIRQMNQGLFEIKGFRLFDRVRYNGLVMFVTNRRQRGFFAVRDIDYCNKVDLTCSKLCLDRVKRNMIDMLKL